MIMTWMVGQVKLSIWYEKNFWCKPGFFGPWYMGEGGEFRCWLEQNWGWMTWDIVGGWGPMFFLSELTAENTFRFSVSTNRVRPPFWWTCLCTFRRAETTSKCTSICMHRFLAREREREQLDGIPAKVTIGICEVGQVLRRRTIPMQPAESSRPFPPDPLIFLVPR